VTNRDPLHQYGSLLGELSEWFQSLLNRFSNHIHCGEGCAHCCRGLFDISLPDALSVANGFNMLPDNLRSSISTAAGDIQKKIVREIPELKESYFLQAVSEDRIDEIVERVGEVSCPFLDDKCNCLIYDRRPLACRLEGIPMVDVSDGLFGDWCELNFRGGMASELAEALRLDYYRIQQIETEATAYISSRMRGDRQEGITLFIPSVIAAAESFSSLSLNIFEPLS